MNGARVLLEALARNGVTTCFMNPGTSEMHFVAALDEVDELHGVLCLFEGVAAGAADGYARVTGRPAATLLHLGPGLGNAFANLHNARRAHSPVLNVVGDHATYHQRYDAPLQSDVASLARALEGAYRSCARAEDVGLDVADAIRDALGPPGRISTLVLPADVSWNEAGASPAMPLVGARVAARTPDESVTAAAAALGGGRAGLLLGGTACRRRGLVAAAKLAAATGCRLLTETFVPVLDRAPDLVVPERLSYLAEFARTQLEGLDTVVLAGSVSPVSFFAYPGVPSSVLPDGCAALELAGPGTDVPAALEELAERCGAGPGVPRAASARPELPTGPLDPRTFAATIGALLPEGCVVVDESNTSGIGLQAATQDAPPHEWVSLTGGAIGFGLPAAVGAAVGAGGRRVVCFEADGSMCYTPQALWTMAREELDVTVVALANDSYAILNFELSRVGAAGGGERARAMLDLTGPTLDLAAVARGFGVPAVTVATADELAVEFEKSLSTPGPSFLSARLSR